MASLNRRSFIHKTVLAGLSTAAVPSFLHSAPLQAGKRIGIIGLDTSHSTAFAESFNAANPAPELNGYKVTVAYPYGSRDIKTSFERIPEYTEKVKSFGVKIVDSIKELLQQCDVVLLETNDGRLHLQQATDVIKAGKRLFIDKPVAASLKDAKAIFAIAAQYKVPVFSSSSLRYMKGVQEVVGGKIGKVLGADTYSPASLEKSHMDLAWYGIHGVETLYSVMGTGCEEVVRMSTEGTDLVTGVWGDGRIGTFRGTRTGKHDYGGIAFGESGNALLGPFDGYTALLYKIAAFFDSGVAPVSAAETIEIFAFMEAADLSKKQGGKPVKLKQMVIN